jgi:hypothetical protein
MASELEELRSKILGLLAKGPVLTIDAAEALGKDTTQTAAILDYYVGQNDITKTERRYGTSSVYYLKKDVDTALTKLYPLLNNSEKALINKVKTMKVVKTEDLLPSERYISKSLGDFLKTVAAKDSDTGKRMDYVYYYQLSLDDVKTFLNGEQEKESTSQTHQKQPPKKEQAGLRLQKRAKLSEPVSEEIKNMLFGHGFSSVTRLGQDIYQCEYGPNRLRTVVIIAMKPGLTKRDFIRFSGYSASYKTVVFVITGAKKIADYSEYGSTINIIRVM